MSEEKFPPKEVKNHAPSYSTKNKFFIRANLPQLNSTSTLFDSLNSFPSIPEIPEIYIHPEEETFDTRYSKVQKEIKKKNQREKSWNNTRQINGKRKSFSQPSSLPSFLRLLLSTRRSNFSIPFDRFFNTSERKWKTPSGGGLVSKRDQVPPPFESFITNLMKGRMPSSLHLPFSYYYYLCRMAAIIWTKSGVDEYRLNWINGNGGGGGMLYLSLWIEEDRGGRLDTFEVVLSIKQGSRLFSSFSFLLFLLNEFTTPIESALYIDNFSSIRSILIEFSLWIVINGFEKEKEKGIFLFYLINPFA